VECDEEDDYESVQPRRRRIEDEDDYEADDDPPLRSPPRRKKRRRQRASGGLDPFVVGLIGAGGVGLVLAVLAFIWPGVSLAAIGVGGIIALAGGIWFLVVAFQDSAAAGLLCLFVPFYSLYYLISNFEETKKPFFVQLVGSAIMIIGSFAGAASAAKQVGNLRKVESIYKMPDQFGAAPS
jgi:hypothetical protein